MFSSKELDWGGSFMHYHEKLPQITLEEKFFVFGLSTATFCSFCNSFGENITHLFCDCTITQRLWKKLQLKLKDNITLFPLTPHAAIFGFLEADCQCYLI